MQYQHEKESKQFYLFEGKNFFLIDEYKLWSQRYSDDKKIVPLQPNDMKMNITLSEPFFDLIKRHAVPFDLRILTTLRQSTLAMDIYLWLTYKFQKLKKPTTIPWKSLKHQFGRNYANDRSGRSVFKKRFKEALRLIHTTYADAKIDLTEAGIILSPSCSSVKKRTMGKSL